MNMNTSVQIKLGRRYLIHLIFKLNKNRKKKFFGIFGSKKFYFFRVLNEIENK